MFRHCGLHGKKIHKVVVVTSNVRLVVGRYVVLHIGMWHTDFAIVVLRSARLCQSIDVSATVHP